MTALGIGLSAHATVLSSTLLDVIFPQKRSSPAACYLLAAATCVAAFLMRLAADPLLHNHSPLILFSLAVAASAIRGGFGPGAFATCLGALLAVYFFPPQGRYFAIDPEYRSTAFFQLSMFVAVGFMLSWLGGSLLDLRWTAVHLAQQRSEILESITDGFAALDSNQRFVYLNSAAAQLIGAAKSGVIGKKIWEAVPDWKDGPVENACRDASERRIPIRLEYFWRPSSRWFEFHTNGAVDGRVTIYFSDVTVRKATEQRLRDTLAERDAALKNVHLLSGLLPICAVCKKIRDAAGDWQQLERYISTHSQAEFSHSYCPECAERFLADLVEPGTSKSGH